MDLFIARVSFPRLEQLKKKEDSELRYWWRSLRKLTSQEMQLIKSTYWWRLRWRQPSWLLWTEKWLQSTANCVLHQAPGALESERDKPRRKFRVHLVQHPDLADGMAGAQRRGKWLARGDIVSQWLSQAWHPGHQTCRMVQPPQKLHQKTK